MRYFRTNVAIGDALPSTYSERKDDGGVRGEGVPSLFINLSVLQIGMFCYIRDTLCDAGSLERSAPG